MRPSAGHGPGLVRPRHLRFAHVAPRGRCRAGLRPCGSDSRSCRDLPDGDVLVNDSRKKLFVVGNVVVGLTGNDEVADALATRLERTGSTVTPDAILDAAALAGAEVGWRRGQANTRCSVVIAIFDGGPRSWIMADQEWFCLRPETSCGWIPPPGRCASHLVRRAWRHDIGRDEAHALFIRFVEETAAVNGYVGGAVQLAWVDADGARLGS